MSNQIQREPVLPPQRRGGRFIRWLGRIAAGLVILSLIGAIYETVSEASDRRAYPPPGQMVDVGGYRLHINCTGTGSPTVVIDAGLGDWSSSWGIVQAEVSKTTRVCTYDRAGNGWSEPGQLPRDANQFVIELHTLLQEANIPAPFVLVGHSLGGLTVRVFTNEYPAEVAGVVLIDSMSPGQTRLMPMGRIPQTGSPTHTFSPLPILARIGVVRLLLNLVSFAADVPPDEKSTYAISASPTFMQAMADETQGISYSLDQAAAVQSFGDLPLIVLSRGLDPSADWQAGQARLLLLSTNNEQLFAEESGHNIEIDQPKAAAEAIVKMVNMVRQQ